MGVRLRITEHYYQLDGSSKSYSRNMRCDELYAALGLDPKKHLPDEGVPLTLINGVPVYILSKDMLLLLQETWRESGRRRQPMKRTFAICTCGRAVEAGHLHQHKCKA